MSRGAAAINRVAISSGDWRDAFRLTPDRDGLFMTASGENMQPLHREPDLARTRRR
jgi:hypothetical protein